MGASLAAKALLGSSGATSSQLYQLGLEKLGLKLVQGRLGLNDEPRGFVDSPWVPVSGQGLPVASAGQPLPSGALPGPPAATGSAAVLGSTAAAPGPWMWPLAGAPEVSVGQGGDAQVCFTNL